jgi:hypothetical protein
MSKPELNYAAIEVAAAAASAAIAVSLKAEVDDCARTGAPFNALRFRCWLEEALDHKAGLKNEEDEIGFLIALTGAIHDYLENETGVTFTPR